MKLKVYGCRASIASTSFVNDRYGNNTSCFLLEAGGQKLILDAGSGLMQLQSDFVSAPFKPDILLSHLHLDHTIGLTVYDAAWNPSGGTRIFTCLRGTKPLKEQIFGAFGPPYWPLPMDKVAHAECLPVFPGKTFTLGSLKITPFVAQHPDTTISFHVTDGKKTLVYLLDSEIPLMSELMYAQLIEYCREVDLVVFDASYTPDDYISRRGWGHSTVREAVELKADSGCKQILLTHFEPLYSDETIDTLKYYPGAEGFLVAREGMEIDI